MSWQPRPCHWLRLALDLKGTVAAGLLQRCAKQEDDKRVTLVYSLSMSFAIVLCTRICEAAVLHVEEELRIHLQLAHEPVPHANRELEVPVATVEALLEPWDVGGQGAEYQLNPPGLSFSSTISTLRSCERDRASPSANPATRELRPGALSLLFDQLEAGVHV